MKKLLKLLKLSILLTMVFGLLNGCASIEQAKILPNDPDFAPILPEIEEDPIVPTGSLFKANYVNNIY